MKLSIRMLILEILAVLVLSAIVGAGVLAWRLSQGPLDLAFLKPQVEAALSRARDGRKVSVETLALEWSLDKKSIEATVRGVTAFDRNGNVQATAERGAIEIETTALIKGDFKVHTLQVAHGRASLLRDESGQWLLVSANGDTEPLLPEASIPTTSNVDVTEWRTLIPQLRAAITQRSFERVEFSNFDFDLTDKVSGISWTALDANGAWEANSDGVLVDVSADLEGEDAPSAMQISFYTDAAVERFSFEIGVVEADPERLAAFLAAEDFPVRYEGVTDFNFGGAATEEEGLQTVQFSAAGESGTIVWNDARYDINAISLEVLLDLETRRLDLTQLNIDSAKLKGRFDGWTDLSPFFQGVNEPEIPVTFGLRDTWVDVTPIFELPWELEAVDFTGLWRPLNNEFEFERVIGRLENLNATGNGRIYLETQIAGDLDGSGEADTESKTLAQRIGVEFQAEGEGKVQPNQVLAFWPVNLGAGARNWAQENVHAGQATKLKLDLELPPGANSQGLLPNKHLTLDFWVEDAEISFLEDLPAITDASGKGRLRGNSLSIELDQAELNGWVLEGGMVDLPQFHPAGATSIIKTSARGDLSDLMQMLDQSRLKLGENYGLAVDRMAGLGGLDIEVHRPMGDGVDIEDIDIKVTGGFVNAVVPDLHAGFGLVRTDVDVEVTQNKMMLRGAGKFGPAPVEFVWDQVFDDPTGTKLTAEAVVTPDFMNAFGVAARTLMQGEAEMSLNASGDGRNFEFINAKFDFTHSAIDLSEIGWLKPFGYPAVGEVRYGRSSDGEAVATGDIRAVGLELAGEIVFDAESGVRRATIERIFAEDRLDLRGDLSRNSEGDVRINVSGPFMDASPWLDGVTDFSGGASGPGVNVLTNLAVDKMKLREGAELLNAKVVVDMAASELRRALVSGTISRGKGVEATLDRQGDELIFDLRSDDAGFVVKTLTKTDYLLGGTLNVNGVFSDSLGAAQVHMDNVRLKDAPLLAQMFSLASLRGLADVLNGDGVLFTSIDAPVRLKDGRFEFPGARASGPAMGLTMRGWTALDGEGISLDGVIVPSFGVNSALGGIPIIGDLFVSRQGEGVFAVTYSVRGTLERARVAINPLSAVTPGFLRRIMENPEETPQVNDEAVSGN